MHRVLVTRIVVEESFANLLERISSIRGHTRGVQLLSEQAKMSSSDGDAF